MYPGQILGSVLVGLSLLVITSLTQAGTMGSQTADKSCKHFEFSAAGGVNWYNAPNTRLIISPFETDLIQVDHSSNKGTWKLGLGYYLFADKMQNHSYLNRLLMEVNVYQTAGTLNGRVWQYELPEFDNYLFRSPIKTTRLMLDIKPNLFTWNRISPYIILGAGSAWSRVSYNEAVAQIDIDPESRLFLPYSTKAKAAFDLGGGFNVGLSNCLSATVEYIYAFLGNGFSPSYTHYRVNLAKAPRFSLHTQSLYFGLSLKI
jgi:opacity protein-like surface antigen